MLLVVKRLIDILASVVLFALLSPLLLATAVAIWIKLGSPVLFHQKRVGKDNRVFMLYKFRSMTDARDKDGKLLSDQQRITLFGRLIRSTSLDELPELWNILKGDMSFVGPRPLLPEYLPYYSETERRRHLMRPGLTGLAQVKGRNQLSWEDRLSFDVWYVAHWNLWLDIKIAFATIGVVLLRKGIHAQGEATMPRFDDYVRARRKATSGA